MQQATDCLLLQFTLAPAPTERLTAVATQLCADSGLQLQRLACAQSGQAYLYARLPQRTLLGEEVLPSLAAALGRRIPAAHDICVSRLQQAFQAPGLAHKEVPVFHYVVETDPEAGWQAEMERWYDTEHMPGLAGVPGCILAQRYYNHDHGPLSLACYDLVSEQVLGSPPWLAVRGTAWSDIVRPHFTNTQRTMFRALG